MGNKKEGPRESPVYPCGGRPLRFRRCEVDVRPFCASAAPAAKDAAGEDHDVPDDVSEVTMRVFHNGEEYVAKADMVSCREGEEAEWSHIALTLLIASSENAIHHGVIE